MKQRKLVCGVGINDADYVVQSRVNGKVVWCQFYQTWTNMIKRCYGKKHPNYISCKVCPEWKSFMTFRAWAKTQDREGRELDKDLLGDGKLYSPETCRFVEPWLNKLLNINNRSRGNFPLGVDWRESKGKFRASLKVDGTHKHLGYFDSSAEASFVYYAARLSYVVASVEDYPDQRIKQAVIDKAEKLFGNHLTETT